MGKEAIWNFWAKRYEDLWVQKYSLGPTRREILLYLTKLLKPDRTYSILDVGCGTGQLLREINLKFPACQLELLGIDYSQEMIKRAKQAGDSISYRQMDVSDCQDLGEKFDLITCTHSFPYYDDQSNTVSQFHDLLKTGGCLLLAQASQNNIYDHLLMSLVKLTTGRANYPSVNSVLGMTGKFFHLERVIKIKERFFMPSIYFFVLIKK